MIRRKEYLGIRGIEKDVAITIYHQGILNPRVEVDFISYTGYFRSSANIPRPQIVGWRM